MKKKIIKCAGDISVDVLSLKKNDVLFFNIPTGYIDLEDYEGITTEAKRLSNNLEKELGFKIPIIILMEGTTIQIMDRDEVLDMLKND